VSYQSSLKLLLSKKKYNNLKESGSPGMQWGFTKGQPNGGRTAKKPEPEEYKSNVIDSVPLEYKAVMDDLVKAGHKSYFVGGAVRDTILGKPPKDWDITTSAPVEESVKVLENLGTVLGIGQQYGIAIGTINGKQIEVASFRKDLGYSDKRRPDEVITRGVSEEEDVQRRDFTMNGLLMDLRGNIKDYVGGIDDLSKKIIRFIGDPDARVAEDSIRMLRAVRFATRFDFNIDEDSLEAIRRNRQDIYNTSYERIRDELDKSFGKNPQKAVELLQQTGLDKTLFGELNPKDFPKTVESTAIVWGSLLSDKGLETYKLPVGVKKTVSTIKKLGEDYENVSDDPIERKKLKIAIEKVLPVEEFDKFLKMAGKEQKFNLKSIKVPEDTTPLVQGKDLMNLGKKPGKNFSDLLNKGYSMQLQGKSKEEILNILRNEGVGYSTLLKIENLLDKREWLNETLKTGTQRGYSRLYADTLIQECEMLDLYAGVVMTQLLRR